MSKRIAKKQKTETIDKLIQLTQLTQLIRHAPEWHNIQNIKNRYSPPWIPFDIRGRNIAPYDYCIRQMKPEKISKDEADELLSACFYSHGQVDDVKKLETYLIKTFGLHISADTLFKSMYIRHYSDYGFRIIKYVFKYYIPDWDDLVKMRTVEYYPHNPISILQKVLEHTKYDNLDFSWLDVVLENDPSVTAETVITKQFIKNARLMLDEKGWVHIKKKKFYAYLLEKFYKPPVNVINLIKIANTGISYLCFRNLTKKSKLSDTDFYELFNYIQVRNYTVDDGDIVTDFAKYICKNEQIVSATIEWLCKQSGILKYVRAIHKKTKCKFEKSHLEAAIQHVKLNFGLIKYILENSDRENIKITKVLIEKVMEQQKLPRIFCLLLDYME